VNLGSLALEFKIVDVADDVLVSIELELLGFFACSFVVFSILGDFGDEGLIGVLPDDFVDVSLAAYTDTLAQLVLYLSIDYHFLFVNFSYLIL
jgi:hypothetical protein